MRIENRRYRIWDFFRIPFTVSPGLVFLRVAGMLFSALIPAQMVLATAGFVDTSICILNGQAGRNEIFLPLIWILLITAYQYISDSVMGLVRGKMNVKLTETFRTAVTEKRVMLEYRHIENQETWDFIERVGKDPAQRLSSGFDILLQMAGMVFRVGSVMLVLAAQVWWAALAIILFSIPLFWLAVQSGRANYEASREAAKYTRRAQYFQEMLTGRDYAEERSLFSYADEIHKQYSEKYTAAYKINMKAQRRQFVKMKTASLITVLISVATAGVLIAPLGTGAISAGMFMGFVTATFGLAQMMSWDLTDITSSLAGHREYLRDLSAFSRLSETFGAADLPACGDLSPERIEFRGVSFAYPGTDRLILKNLDLTLSSKKQYAFVGANGTGKTTITKLLTGLYDNYTGEILIDGKDLRSFTQAELKSLFSIVYQDFARYQIPLRDSIGIGEPRQRSVEPVHNAIKDIGLEQAVSKLPEGINTPVGKIEENGIDLSGGEWQKVAIARTLINQAPVRILDEPTAALDPAAESELYELFGKISKGKFTILITHRLGAARLADEIFVIDDGHAAEHGSHEELMAKGGVYAEMFEAQKGWYV